MRYVGLYHLNAYTYADPTWFPDMDPELRAMFQQVTKGSLSGKAGEPAKEDFKINGQYVDTPDQGVVGIPFFDGYVEKAALDFLDQASQSDEPFFINVNFMKVHQPNLPAPDYEHKSLSKSKYAEFGRRARRAHRPHHGQGARARSRREHAGVLHDRQRRLAGRLPRRRLHAVPRHQGDRARGRQPGARDRLDAGQDRGRQARATTSLGGLDLMATFAAVAGVELPKNDREGKPIIFDSYDMSPILFGTGRVGRASPGSTSPRTS